MSNFRPIFDNILVKPQPVTETVKGGIIIPQSVMDSSEPLAVGLAVAVGEKCEVVTANCMCLYSKSAGSPITINDDDLLLMRESEVLMIE